MNSPASPSVNGVSQELPTLPKPLTQVSVYGDEYGKRKQSAGDYYYTADQMREYAHASIAVQPPAASQPSAQPPAGEVAKDAEILRALLTQYVEADEDRLGWIQCMKSQLYREALKTLDSAQVLPTKE